MAQKMVINTDELRFISFSLKAVARSVENVVDTLPDIRRLSAETWDTEAQDIFEENCRKLQKKCVEMMVDIDNHSNMLREAIGVYESKEGSNKSKVSALSRENIF